MKTCATCLCWHKTGHSPVPRRIVSDTGVRVIEPGLEGQCHRSSPVEDFRWPLTSAGDWCAEHRTEPTMTTLESTDQIVRALDCSLRPALTPETIKILETGTPGRHPQPRHHARQELSKARGRRYGQPSPQAHQNRAKSIGRSGPFRVSFPAMTTMTNTLPKPKRRHRAVVHGTKIERRAKKPTRLGSLYEAAEDFNEAFDTVFPRPGPGYCAPKAGRPTHSSNRRPRPPCPRRQREPFPPSAQPIHHHGIKKTTAKPKKTARGTPFWSKLRRSPPARVKSSRTARPTNSTTLSGSSCSTIPAPAELTTAIKSKSPRHGTQVLDVQFQKGPVQEQGVNGGSIEALAAVVIDRLEGFQGGPYACDENADALAHFTAGLEILKARTAARQARGVEGTSVV